MAWFSFFWCCSPFQYLFISTYEEEVLALLINVMAPNDMVLRKRTSKEIYKIFLTSLLFWLDLKIQNITDWTYIFYHFMEITNILITISISYYDETETISDWKTCPVLLVRIYRWGIRNPFLSFLIYSNEQQEESWLFVLFTVQRFKK